MLLILSSFLFAETPKVIYKEKTEIDFEALDIEGQSKKPTMSTISQREEITFNSLIILKEDWYEEMIESLDDIK